jgi:hypothetical protein
MDPFSKSHRHCIGVSGALISKINGTAAFNFYIYRRCDCGNEFTEESNFEILQVVRKVKLANSESGWIVKIKEVTDDDVE